VVIDAKRPLGLSGRQKQIRKWRPFPVLLDISKQGSRNIRIEEVGAEDFHLCWPENKLLPLANERRAASALSPDRSGHHIAQAAEELHSLDALNVSSYQACEAVAQPLATISHVEEHPIFLSQLQELLERGPA
jgi:hypothetical protein